MARIGWTTAIVLAAAAAHGAAPAVTIGERQRAVNLHKRLVGEPTEAPKDLSNAMARIYLRRAYVIDLGPAESVAKEVLKPAYRGRPQREIKDDRRLKLFAWMLDAMVHGAEPKDLMAALRTIWKETYREADRISHAEAIFGCSRRYASPVPLANLIRELGNNGVVGRRQREFITWAAGLVKRGEDPAYLSAMYQATSKVNPSSDFQRRVLDIAYDAIRRGAPPDRMADALAKLSARTDVPRRFEQGVQDIAKLYLGGLTFEQAVDQVVPPEKKAATPGPG
jgi:hypothetical protein